MELPRFTWILLLIAAILNTTIADTRYYTKLNDNAKNKSRAIIRIEHNDPILRDSLKASNDRRNSFIETSTFDPDVLNKFLDEYANKIKISTEKPFHPFKATKSPPVIPLEIDDGENSESGSSTDETITENGFTTVVENIEGTNDTAKRNKFYNQASTQANDDRNGWVTLEAIPWSKSKISKWQANANSQKPWPESNKWDKPSGGKPWASEQNNRPYYENNKPWYDKPKPQWQEPETQRPKPPPPSRPSYTSDRFDTNPSQAQKWPPERPSSSWEDFPANYRPNTDIITDNRPSNFPISNNWDKYDQISKPMYSSFNDRYHNDPEENGNDWPNHDKPNYSRPRPYYSHYEYNNRHPPSHPSTGDGEWVLLSTNRGYQKQRQRSLKFERIDDVTIRPKEEKDKELPDPAIAVMTSKRQVRLTVLPSINGTNTTTSHGGLLEVEKTFMTVDQSQREFEANQLKAQNVIKKRKPIKAMINGRPSNSAVLAAVSAGMVPATMAMMIPMILGRKKRSIEFHRIFQNHTEDKSDKHINLSMSS